jgi:hypothetical protein
VKIGPPSGMNSFIGFAPTKHYERHPPLVSPLSAALRCAISAFGLSGKRRSPPATPCMLLCNMPVTLQHRCLYACLQHTRPCGGVGMPVEYNNTLPCTYSPQPSLTPPLKALWCRFITRPPASVSWQGQCWALKHQHHAFQEPVV